MMDEYMPDNQAVNQLGQQPSMQNDGLPIAESEDAMMARVIEESLKS